MDETQRPGRQLKCYDYVNRTYTRVRDALASDAAGIFNRATRRAADHAETLVATIHASLGPLDVGADIEIQLDPAVEDTSGAEPKTHIGLRWTASRGAALFPMLDATLCLYPLTSTETQLELRGAYRPPLGPLGAAIDSLAMHRVAEASVLRFLSDVAGYLGATISES